MDHRITEELKSHAPESAAVNLGRAIHEELVNEGRRIITAGQTREESSTESFTTPEQAEKRLAELKAELDAKGVEYVIIDESSGMPDADALARAKAVLIDIQGRNAQAKKLAILSQIGALGYKKTVAQAFGRKLNKVGAGLRLKELSPKPKLSALAKQAKYLPCSCGSGKKAKFCCG